MLKAIWVELMRGWQTQLNYPFSLILSIVQNFIFMGVAIWILSSLTSLEEVLGVLFWPVALTSLASCAQSIQDDMHLGTFERIASSKISLLGILMARSIADFILATLLTVLAILLASIILHISIPIMTIIIILLLIFLTGTGLSLTLTGLQIYYRDTGPLGNMIIFGSMISLVIPWEGWLNDLQHIFYTIIPFSAGAIYIQTMNNEYLLFAIVNAILYFLIGLISFPYLYKKTRLIKGLGRY